MKKTILIITATISMNAALNAQDAYTQQLQQQVAKLDNATTANDYQQLSGSFLRIAEAEKTKWLPYYYAAFCNAKTGWLKQDDPDNIETFANKAEEEIKKAQSLLDTSKQKSALSELYCVFSMINRARVFMNPATYGRQYGPLAGQYTALAKKTDPDNPRALYLEGWEKFSTPKLWGGDKTKAKELLTSAKQKLDMNTSPGIEPHWGRQEVDELLKQLNKQ
jgi:hypothetical protein